MLMTPPTARPRGLHSRTVPAFTPILIALSLLLAEVAHAAGALPNGGHFVAGTGSIAGNATSLTINQTSNRGIIDWTNFSIGNGDRVKILNGNGATLNRVTGANPSSILGTLSGTGSVYLINPQGIVIGSSGIVSTGGRFVASTLDTDNMSFMNGGPLTLSGSYTSPHSVANLGKISSSNGDVFLISNRSLVNGGTISAPKGTAELVVGGEVLLHDSSTSQQVFVLVPFSTNGATVVNRGTLDAAQISLLANENIYALAGNHAVLRATGTATRDGHVWLVTGHGNMTIASTIEARNANGSGGTADMVADNFSIGSASKDMPFVHANQWNITAQKFGIGRLSAPVFQRSLNRGTSINIQATGVYGVDASGDIDVASSVQWFGPASLTLLAHHSLTIEAAAKLKNTGTGNLTLRADSGAIDNRGSVINNGTVDWSASNGIVSAFYDMNGSYKPGKLLANASWTSPGYSGLVTQITGYKLVNSYDDLKNVSKDLAGIYALGTDIDASASKGSYVPIGSNATPFTGQFDGEGHTIESLDATGVSDGSPIQEGLFGTLGVSAVVRNLNVNGTAGIAGGDDPSFPFGTYAAEGHEGMLAADNYGTVLRVNTSGNINNDAGFGDLTTAGGLVGVNHGTIERSSSSVDANAGGPLGGLVGENDGIIAQSYASGSMTADEHDAPHGTFSLGTPGGLVGTNNGRITESYATGAVTCITSYNACGAGGLVNTNNGFISQSFASGVVTAVPTIFGVPGNPGGIAVVNDGSIASDVYWNKDTTGVTAGVASGTPLPASNGLTTAQMSNPASFSGWNFSSTGAWALPPSYSHPILRWQLDPPVTY